MNTTLATANPRFHSLNGNQPVGSVRLATMPEYAGTVTSVKRCNDTYWVVVTRSARGAFTDTCELGAACAIWMDPTTMQFVVDYYDGSTNVEADRTRTLPAAIGVACDVTAQRWLASR